MRLVVTGGGTGGHVYPALEVAKMARSDGADVRYLGSLRGQEAAACAPLGFPFQGFPAEPLYSIRTVRGMKALVRLQQSRFQIRRVFRDDRPDVVFSTGGYSGGPVAAAARDLQIPYILHSIDSIPARSLSMFAAGAAGFTSVFRSTERYMTSRSVIRTGQPIRDTLRAESLKPRGTEPNVLVVGGSQGSAFLNSLMPKVAAQLGAVSVTHVVGRANLEGMKSATTESYKVVPYLDSAEMAAAYRAATVVVARSGGTLAEIAMFGLPSILVPLPNSANDHQQRNAEEFAEMGAAAIFDQSSAEPIAVAQAITGWIDDSHKREKAQQALREWDIPDATERIISIIRQAASRTAAAGNP